MLWKLENCYFIVFADIQTLVSQQLKFDFFHQSLIRKLHIFARWFDGKTNFLILTLEFWLSEKSKCLIMLIVSLFKLIFLGNYRYDFSNVILHGKHCFCGQGLRIQLFFFHPGNRLVTFQVVKKLLFILNSAKIQNFYPQPLRVGLPPSRSESKT